MNHAGTVRPLIALSNPFDRAYAVRQTILACRLSLATLQRRLPTPLDYLPGPTLLSPPRDWYGINSRALQCLVSNAQQEPMDDRRIIIAGYIHALRSSQRASLAIRPHAPPDTRPREPVQDHPREATATSRRLICIELTYPC